VIEGRIAADGQPNALLADFQETFKAHPGARLRGSRPGNRCRFRSIRAVHLRWPGVRKAAPGYNWLR
jgi:hypothetical protein